MENSTKILIGAIAVVGIGTIVYYRMKDSKMVAKDATCFDLPKEVDPAVFGPHYWNAFHTLAHNVPCGACRGFAEKFMVFFHDIVNVKNGVPLFDSKNYYYFLQSISNLNKGQLFNEAFKLS